MMKTQVLVWSLILLMMASSCKSTRKLQTTVPATITKDTTIFISDTSNKTTDPLAPAKKIISSLLRNRIGFNTFTAKINVTYKDNELDEDATLNIRMKEDSIIWLSITGAFGIEGLRAIITQDSVHIINKLDKVVQHESIRYISNILKVPVTITTLQDIILGNPVFVYDVAEYSKRGDNVDVQTMGQLLSNLLTVKSNDNTFSHSKIIDRDTTQFRVLDLDYSDYDAGKGVNFAKQRSINITDRNMLQVQMKFKDFKFDESVSYPFNIPKNYTVK